MQKSKQKIYLSICLSSIIILLGSFYFILPPTYFTQGLQDLSAIKKLVATKNENPNIDGKNLVKAKYISFLQNDVASFFVQRCVDIFGLLHMYAPTWSPSYFHYLIKKLVKNRQEKRYRGNFVHKISTPKNAKFVVFGDLYGAVHSLVRDLEQLVKLNILDQNLKLTSPDMFIIFLGGVVGRSPYIMLTLSIIMQLMDKNADQVFLLQGSLETKNNWKRFGFPDELKIRARRYCNEKIPFQTIIEKFFATLPRALYLQMPGRNVYDIIRLSYVGTDKKDFLDEDNFPRFLRRKSKNTVATFRLDEKKDPPLHMKNNVKALIRSQIKRKMYRKYDGARLLSPENDATTWAILSSPTSLYQQALQFKTDTFVLLEEHGRVHHWTIEHYWRDVTKNKEFRSLIHDLLSGAVIEDKFVEKKDFQKEKEIEIEQGEEDSEVIVPYQFEKLYRAHKKAKQAKRKAKRAKLLK